MVQINQRHQNYFFLLICLRSFQITSSATTDQKPLKSGEIFRTECGKFSFVCTYCNTICRNGEEIMDHINSHFNVRNSVRQENIEMSDQPLALPEFISVNEIKHEPDVEATMTPTGKNVGKVKNEPTTPTKEPNSLFGWPQTNVHNADRAKSPAKTRIVTFVKRKSDTKPSLLNTTLKMHNSKIVRIIQNHRPQQE